MQLAGRYPAWSWVLQSLFESKPEEALTRIENYPYGVLVMQQVWLAVEVVRGMLGASAPDSGPEFWRT